MFFSYNIQPYVSWKGKSTNSAVPNYARPLDGSEQYETGPSFSARPIKHWRKQLNANKYNSDETIVNRSSRGRAGVGMPMDIPGGSVYLGNNESNKDCITCIDDITKTTGLKEDIIKTNNTDFFTNPSDKFYDESNNKTVCVACNPENNIIRRATTNISKKYYSDTKGYLKSRCLTYDQNMSLNPASDVTYFNSNGVPLYPTNSPTGPQVRNTKNCLEVCENKPNTTIYKPNNTKYAVQGAVSSGARLDRLKYNTITANGASFNTAYGSQGANAGKYHGSSTSPYFLKSKQNICESSTNHKNGNKHICDK